MKIEEIRAKWDRFYADADEEPEPAAVLGENAHLLPDGGTALDLACGLGGNALFLARRGFEVSAWDISPVAIARLSARSNLLDLNVDAKVRDVETDPFPQPGFDVIVVSRFLARPLAGAIIDSLRPGGLLFYQTYIRDKPTASGPSNPDYLLGENELLAMFDRLKLVFYREEARIGDLGLGNRNEAFLVGRLPVDGSKRIDALSPANGKGFSL
ncbi:MAG: methyltransferase domain-containing protein [Methylococcaceae bacterium]|nr:methyltransferase domain-containing protein [Methylococcaceae bacterium]